MKKIIFVTAVSMMALCLFPQASGQATANKVIPANAKVFIAPMPDGFDEFLKAAIEKKKVPLQIVVEKDQADFPINRTIGNAESQHREKSYHVGLALARAGQHSGIKPENI